MRHKLRQCKVCGQPFVDRAEIAETCFDCRSGELCCEPAITVELSASCAEPDSSEAGPGASSAGLGSSSQFVVLGSAAVQVMPAPAGSHRPHQDDNPEPIKLWQEERRAASPAKTGWSSPPFKVRFEDHVDWDLPVESPPRQTSMRARYKILLAGAALLIYFLWPVMPHPVPEDQVALDEPAATSPVATSAVPSQEPVPVSQQPDDLSLLPSAADDDDTPLESPGQ